VGVDQAEESAWALGDTEEQESTRRRDGDVDTVLDRREDGDEDTSKENHKLEWRGLPVLVDFPRGRDEIADGVDDDG
jgi:hypothetical protein